MVAMRSLAHVVILLLLPSVVAAGQTAPRTEKEKTTAARDAGVRPEAGGRSGRPRFGHTPPEPSTSRSRPSRAGRGSTSPWSCGWSSSGCTGFSRPGLVYRKRAELTGTLLRGLSLHTDIAIAERNAQAPPGLGRAAVILVDGQETRSIGRSAHWPIARQIAAELATRARPEKARASPRGIAPPPPDAAMARLDLLGMHLEVGQALFVDDPVLALYQGTLRQTFGDPRLHDYLRKRGSTEGFGKPPLASRHGATDRHERLGPVPTAVPNATRVELGVAERELRRALTLDPTLHEARIRLAHVLSRLGDDRQAVEVVRPALEAPLPPFSEFYAALILGRSEEQLGRFDEAGVAYARAAARFPGAQSAEIGRSRVALAQGRAADALKILVDVVGPFSTEQPDPWLDYLKRARP